MKLPHSESINAGWADLVTGTGRPHTAINVFQEPESHFLAIANN